MGNLGNDWSWYPSSNDQGKMNIVSSPARVVASRILHLLLTQYGEDPIHPTLGIAPKLFDPLSSTSVQYFVYQAKEEILKWNESAKMGIRSLSVEFESMQEYRSNVTVNIKFVCQGESNFDTLAFGYWEYTGVKSGIDLENFLNNVTLNGERFPSF